MKQEKTSNKKPKYWYSFKRNWPLIVGPTFAIAVGIFLFTSFWFYGMNYVTNLQDSNTAIIGLVVMVSGAIKLLAFMGYDIFEKWANSILEAMTKEAW